MSGEVTKYKNVEQLISMITTMQESAQIINGLNNTTISNEEEIFFELYKPGDDSTPRYTIYVLDMPYKKKQGQYAAFIVPQGR